MLTEEWARHAQCHNRNVNPNLFFPKQENTVDPDVIEAKEFCASCPVETECLNWALNTRQPNGVWGGKTTRERRYLAKEQAVPA